MLLYSSVSVGKLALAFAFLGGAETGRASRLRGKEAGGPCRRTTTGGPLLRDWKQGVGRE